MKRLFIIVLDSFGIGYSEDADKFGDFGSNTLGHIAEYCKKGKANFRRNGLLKIPNLTCLGLAKAFEYSTGSILTGIDKIDKIIGAYSYASEISLGKDTISGHWEIVGVPVLFNWKYFTNLKNSFPNSFLNELVIRAKLTGFLGNCHASGTEIINMLGEEHIKTGKPIFYTSSDSVLQIACHEEIFGLQHLYYICKISREIFNDIGYNVGRIIARPFIGNKNGQFKRTENRRDFSISPPSVTVLQKLIEEKNGEVISIGKVSDIYANIGITKIVKSYGLDNLFNSTIREIDLSGNNTIVFTNFVDFDSLYGHRRDVAGYAAALEYFDKRVPELISHVRDDDVLIITSDHGCDPTWEGTDHTRENIPILIYNRKIDPGFYGYRKTFSDIGQTIAKFFNLSPMNYGKPIF